MNALPAFGFKELFAHIVGDIAKAVCERNGETRLQQIDRSQAAVHTIMGFLPRDVIEAMLAGHCVMFHEMMVASVLDTLRGELDTMRRATRSSIVAMDKAFANNLSRLEHYQLRPSEGSRDEADARPDTAVEVPDSRPAPVPDAELPSETPLGTVETDDAGVTSLVFTPSAETIALCRANPDAMAALEAGDPERFARAMGVDLPSEAYLDAAAASGSPFDRGFAEGKVRVEFRDAPLKDAAD